MFWQLDLNSWLQLARVAGGLQRGQPSLLLSPDPATRIISTVVVCVRRAGSEAALNEVSSATGMITYPQIQSLQLLRQMVVLQNFVCRFLQWGECCYL